MAGEREVLRRLRSVMARELDTINEYEEKADQTEDPEAKLIFQHLADEEKEHVVEVFEALLARDPAQKAWQNSAHTLAIRENQLASALAGPRPGPTHAAAPLVAAPAQAVAPAPAADAPLPRITVGSLFGKKSP